MKNIFFVILLFSHLGSCSYCFSMGNEEASENAILELFFRSLLNDTPAGYVLFGEKPVYFSSLPSDMDLIPGTSKHKWAIEMWAGLDSYQNLQKVPNQQLSNYVLKTGDFKEKIGVENELLLLNKKEILKTVAENLPLFQYQMGLQITPNDILNNIMDPNIKMSSLFKGQHALLGILLGYGPHNAITYERGVALVQSVTPQSSLPFRSKRSFKNEQELIHAIKASKIEPRLGFSSIKEEIDHLSRALAPPSNNLDGTSTKIAFSYIRESEESQKLLSSYTKAQSSVEHIFNSKNYLAEILQRLRLNEDSAFTKKLPIISANLLARSVWQSYLRIFPDEEKNFEDFLAGMKLADKNLSDKNFEELEILDQLREQRLLFTKNHFRSVEAKNEFSKIAKLDAVRILEPNKIYFRTVSNNEIGDMSLSHVSRFSKEISAIVAVQDFDNHILWSTSPLVPQTFFLSDLVPGFAHGMIGMGVGEVREIWIHPDYLYGIESDVADGKPIKITVKLTAVKDGIESMPELVPVDFEPFRTQNNSWKNLMNQYVMFCGYRTWTHLKQSQKISLNELFFYLRELQRNPLLNAPINSAERSALLRFHWLLYHPITTKV